jgi:hypothetical protein
MMAQLSHSQARELIEQASDGLLETSHQRALESHLKGCADCRAFAAELAGLEGALAAAMKAQWPQKGLSKTAESELVKNVQSGFKPSGFSYPFGGLGILLTVVLLILALLAAFQLLPLDAANADPTMTATPSRTASATATLVPAVIPSETIGVEILTAVPLQNANCREGNGSVFEIADTLFEGEEYSPLGRGFDNQWVLFEGPAFQTSCWVFAENLTLLINDEPVQIQQISETLLPFVNYPPTPTPSPTLTFTPEPSETTGPAIPECNDGVDNDSDRYVDLQDPQCRNAQDDDELNR